tara:strand:+ start:542 stop:772 length:231 start_codon:yes stop_codon:yes gene_type:complete
MKKALLLSLALIALAGCKKYDTIQECYLKEEQKGGRPSTVTNYCMELFSYRAVDDAGLDLVKTRLTRQGGTLTHQG